MRDRYAGLTLPSLTGPQNLGKDETNDEDNKRVI